MMPARLEFALECPRPATTLNRVLHRKVKQHRNLLQDFGPLWTGLPSAYRADCTYQGFFVAQMSLVRLVRAEDLGAHFKPTFDLGQISFASG